MSIHGVFIFKDKKEIWGFHITHDGSCIQDFYEDHVKDLNWPPDIFRKALVYFSDGEYTDCPETNIYRTDFDPDEDYVNTGPEYTLYYDGKEFHNNWDKKKAK